MSKFNFYVTKLYGKTYQFIMEHVADAFDPVAVEALALIASVTL